MIPKMSGRERMINSDLTLWMKIKRLSEKSCECFVKKASEKSGSRFGQKPFQIMSLISLGII